MYYCKKSKKINRKFWLKHIQREIVVLFIQIFCVLIDNVAVFLLHVPCAVAQYKTIGMKEKVCFECEKQKSRTHTSITILLYTIHTKPIVLDNLFYLWKNKEINIY